jgi:CDP-diacylglycerol--glycerol-3-phosphate 3-phosphatidyltransferase
VGSFGPGAALIVLSAILDALDGMVARSRGGASRAGAVLDSCVDRISDAAPLIGLAVFYRAHPAALAVPLAAMVASSLVSYARAKADIYQLALPDGLMRRHERIAYLTGALIFGPIVPTLGVTGALPFPLTLAGVAWIAGVAWVAGLRLIQRTRAALAAVDACAAPAPSAGAARHPRRIGDGKASSALL